jgi:hypothetical protein
MTTKTLTKDELAQFIGSERRGASAGAKCSRGELGG